MVVNLRVSSVCREVTNRATARFCSGTLLSEVSWGWFIYLSEVAFMCHVL